MKTIYHYSDSKKEKFSFDMGTVEAVRVIARLRANYIDKAKTEPIALRAAIYNVIMGAANKDGWTPGPQGGLVFTTATTVTFVDNNTTWVF